MGVLVFEEVNLDQLEHFLRITFLRLGLLGSRRSVLGVDEDRMFFSATLVANFILHVATPDLQTCSRFSMWVLETRNSQSDPNPTANSGAGQPQVYDGIGDRTAFPHICGE